MLESEMAELVDSPGLAQDASLVGGVRMAIEPSMRCMPGPT